MHRRFLPSVALVLLTAPALFAADAPAPIRLANYTDATIIRYPVALLRGELTDAQLSAVTLTNTSSTRDTRAMTGLAYKGRFKVLAELVPGENKLLLKAGDATLPLRLTYTPQTNPYIVRVIWATDSTGDTTYQSPYPNDAQDYAGKLDTMMKLMQTFTAERLSDAGYGRQTFNLELDDRGKVKVHLFKGEKPAEFYYAMNDQAWWGRMYGEIEKVYPMRQAKNVVIAAYTRFDPATGKPKGHTALGGGGQGLFGGGDVFAWPGRLQDAQKVFMDASQVDPKQIFSDSVGRHTRWAITSTTIGATLHELSHTFGLPHTTERFDIMTRGIDYFNRAFTLVEPPHARRAQSYEFKPEEVACFPPISAAALVTSRWFALDDRPWDEKNTIKLGYDAASKALVFESAAGVRYVGISSAGNAVYYTATPPGTEAPEVVRLSLEEVKKKVTGDKLRVRVHDDQGQMRSEDVAKLTGEGK